MAKYVLLLQFTDQGIRSIKDTTKRAAAFRGEIAGKFGVKVSEVLWTLGQYDMVVLAEGPFIHEPWLAGQDDRRLGAPVCPRESFLRLQADCWRAE